MLPCRTGPAARKGRNRSEPINPAWTQRAGGRKNKPPLAANCAGLTGSVLTSQHFEPKRGGLTGTMQDEQGLFETAEGARFGTIQVHLNMVGGRPTRVVSPRQM